MTQDAPTDSGGPGYLAPYEEAVERFGPSFEATLWHSKEGQVKRFAVIASAVDLRGARLIDAGCGLGDLAAYLCKQKVSFKEYVGLEAFDQLVDAASARKIKRARFAVADFVDDAGAFEGHFPASEGGKPDFVIFSGSLNALEVAQAQVVLERAWRACRRGVVFNFLSSRNGEASPTDPSPARRFDPLAMLDWALERTPRVVFRQEYMDGHDATIVMLRDAR